MRDEFTANRLRGRGFVRRENDHRLLRFPQGLEISRFNDTIEVRVTRTGQAAPQRGDLGGVVADVKLGQAGVVLQADKVVSDGR